LDSGYDIKHLYVLHCSEFEKKQQINQIEQAKKEAKIPELEQENLKKYIKK
jgi:hypothetical protein